MAKRDSKGNRIKGEGRFIRVFHHMLDTPAGKSLTPHEMTVLIRLMQLYNGANNGGIAMSSRRAAGLANINKDTAYKCLASLTEKGFLKVTTPSGFGVNSRRAVEYEITCFPLRKSKPAKNTFQDWRPELKEKSSSDIRATTVPNQGHKPKLRVVV